MIWRAVILAIVLGASPAMAQDASASSSAEGGNWIALLGPGSSDTELEQIVRAGYRAAADFAEANRNYFARDGMTEPLRDAIAAGLARSGFLNLMVAGAPSASLGAARACLGKAGTELRFLSNVFGDGLSLAAVTATRAFAFDFDPREMDDVLVYPAEACKPAG